MGRKKKEDRTIKIVGTKTFEDPQTKERIEASVIDVLSTDLKNEWFTLVLGLAGILSPKRLQVITFLLKNMIPNENLVVMTQREIAQKSGISYPTVAQTISQLKKLGVVNTKTGSIQFIPDQNIAITGNQMTVLLRYQSPGRSRAGKRKEDKDRY